MVAQVVDNSGALYFKVFWKFPKDQPERRDYYCKSLVELARILYHAEGITRENVEFIYVHEIKRDNTTSEVITIDKGSSPNMNPHILHSAGGPKVVTDAEKEEEEDVKILSEVYNILKAQPKPHIKLALDKPGVTYAALGLYKAYPAQPFAKEPTT